MEAKAEEEVEGMNCPNCGRFMAACDDFTNLPSKPVWVCWMAKPVGEPWELCEVLSREVL